MTKQEAKRYVCQTVSRILEGAISAGDGWIVDDRSDVDVEKIERAVRELAEELHHRSRRGGRYY